MEIKLKDLETSDSVSEVFTGVEKMKRIKEKLKIMIEHHTKERKSETICRAIELYADTPEEAIGIALEMFIMMDQFVKEQIIKSITGSPLSADPIMDGIMGILKGAHKHKKPSKGEAMGIINRDPRTDEEKDKLYNYLLDAECTICSLHGKCDIQEAGDKFVPEWRRNKDWSKTVE